MIEGKIEEALRLHAQWGERLLGDPGVSALLEGLKQSITRSAEVMVQVGVAEACRRCDEEEGGSCCGAGIEDQYAPSLLLVNLLLGATISGDRVSANSCYFLGEKGCRLRARDILCLNYLCSGLQRMLGPDLLHHLQRIVGEEMERLFRVQEAVRRFMSQGIP